MDPMGSAVPPTPLLVACGLVTLDVVQTVPRLPGPDEKIVAAAAWATFGGPAANAAATAAALGVRARLVTAVGSGPVAQLVRSALADAGVEVVDLLDGGPGQPPVSTVLVTAGTGQRAVVSVNATATAALGDTATARVTELLSGATAVLVDGHHLAAATVLARAARRRGVPVVLDGGSWKPGLGELLREVDDAVLSADFVLPGAGVGQDRSVADTPGQRSAGPDGVDRTLDRVVALGPSFVARSAGPGPVRYLLADGTAGAVAVHAVPAGRIVDTVGAGDVLHGAFAAALARGDGVVDALRDAVRWAAESVRHTGALGWVERSRSGRPPGPEEGAR